MATFPFGQSVTTVAQADRSPKKAFVLGVYASAVHARWVGPGPDGKQKVAALAVASEPRIFWTGEGAKEIIERVNFPNWLGRLLPADERFNGPSGKALDDLVLRPLGFKDRKDVWLCDLLPESRMNPKQKEAIETHYRPICRACGLPEATVPAFAKKELDSEVRRGEILNEIWESKAETLVLLGDLPIRFFLKFHGEPKYSKLSDMVKTPEDYGRPHEMKVDGVPMNVIPLCHPRQAGRLGNSSAKWGEWHEGWMKRIRK